MVTKKDDDKEPKVKVHKMVVYTGTADVRVIEEQDWTNNQSIEGPRLVFHAGNKWMVDAKEEKLSDDVLDYFENDDLDFVVIDSDQEYFRYLQARAKRQRKVMSPSGVLHGRAALVGDAVSRDKIMTSHTGPAEVPGVTDTRPPGVGPMFEQPVEDQEPPPQPTEDAVPIKE